jgi:outer membrane protein
MKSKRRLLGVAGAAIAALAVLAPVSPQAGAGSRTLSIKDVATMAINSSPEVEQAAYHVESGRLAVDRATDQYLPALRLSSKATRSYQQEFDIGSNSFVDDETDMISSSLSIDLDLFTGFGRSASRSHAISRLTASEEDFERVRQSALYLAAAGFLRAATLGEVVEVHREDLEAQQLQLDLIRASEESGNRPVADLYQQMAEVARAEARVIESEEAFESSKLELLQMLGMDPGTRIEIAVPGSSFSFEVPEFHDPEVIVNALESRPDASAQKARVVAAEQDVRASRAGYWPTLTLTAGLGSSYGSGSGDIYGFEDQFLNNNVDGSVGLYLSIPVFDRFDARNSVAQAQVAAKSSRLELDDLERRIESETRNALLGYRTAGKKAQAAKAQLRYAEESLNAYQERYRVGASMLVEVAHARSGYLDARQGLVEARNDLVTRALGVYYYSGDTGAMLNLIDAYASGTDGGE